MPSMAQEVKILGKASPIRFEAPLYTSGVQAGFPSPADDYIESDLDELGMHERPLHNHNARATVARESIRRALESLGFLLVRRKRISPPFRSPLRDKFR